MAKRNYNVSTEGVLTFSESWYSKSGGFSQRLETGWETVSRTIPPEVLRHLRNAEARLQEARREASKDPVLTRGSWYSNRFSQWEKASEAAIAASFKDGEEISRVR